MKTKTVAQMHRMDRHAVRGLGIPVLLLMDNAGRATAEAARTLIGKSRPVIVVTGGGFNGGDGVAAARYLRGWGFPVSVFWLKDPAQWEGDMAVHYRIARKFGVRFRPFRTIPPEQRVPALRKAAVIIDALHGTGLTGPLRVPTYDAIASINAARRPVVAIDIPSGLEADTGRVADIAVKARVTVTLAAAKPGLVKPASRRYVGRLIVADIGIPTSLQ